MPLVLEGVDWNLIRELYNQGMPFSAISMQTGVKQGTISARATREQWKATATKAKQAMQIAIQEEENTPNEQLDLASKRVRTAFAGELERVCDLLEDKPAKSLSTALKRQRQLKPAVENGKVLFGWNDGEQQSIVRIGVMNTCVVASPVASPSSTPPTPEVIDVQSNLISPADTQQSKGDNPLDTGGVQLVPPAVNFLENENCKENTVDYEI